MVIKGLSSTNDYQVSTSVFEGPLDLLLELIERAELDITTIALAKVTDQFLAYLHQLSDLNVDEISGFLVIAARLVQIKSAALLPRPENIDEEPEEDPGEALVRQLKEYKKYKQVALLLANRESEGLRTYLRLATPVIQVQPIVDMGEFDLSDLFSAAQEIFKVNTGLLPLDEVVTLPRITIREKIETILHSFQKQRSLSFSSLLKSRTKVEIVVTFLAVLELIKRNILEVVQANTFSDIDLYSNETELETGELEIEF
jgi:segregation and condensation protein A